MEASTSNIDSSYSRPSRPKFFYFQDGRFGSTDEVLLGRLGSIGVDKSDRVFIGDTDKNNIHVFTHE